MFVSNIHIEYLDVKALCLGIRADRLPIEAVRAHTVHVHVNEQWVWRMADKFIVHIQTCPLRLALQASICIIWI